MTRATPTNGGAGNGQTPRTLPFAQGHSFDTLDAYLAHLQRNSAIDLPYYRQVRPGVYERVTSLRRPGPPQLSTRAELMERYGFTR